MGTGALETIHEQEQAISILSNAVGSVHREIAAIVVNHAESKKRALADWSGLYDFINSVNQNYCELRFRPFLGRLRWLLTGK